MNENKNILIVNFNKAPKKIFYDLDLFNELNMEELYVHLYLLNHPDIMPTMRVIQQLLKTSLGKAQMIVKRLRDKGLIDLMPAEDGRSYVWVVNSNPIDFSDPEQKEFFKHQSERLGEKRIERNREIDAQIERLTREIEQGGDPIDLIKQIRELEKKRV